MVVVLVLCKYVEHIELPLPSYTSIVKSCYFQNRKKMEDVVIVRYFRVGYLPLRGTCPVAYAKA